jgi:hypothetical protein
MANIPVNAAATVISGSGSITGSYAGFTVTTTTVFNGLKDVNGTPIASPSSPLTFTNTQTIPMFVTSASISSGAAIFYI